MGYEAKKQNTRVPRRAVVPIGDERLMQKSKVIASVVSKTKFCPKRESSDGSPRE